MLKKTKLIIATFIVAVILFTLFTCTTAANTEVSTSSSSDGTMPTVSAGFMLPIMDQQPSPKPSNGAVNVSSSVSNLMFTISIDTKITTKSWDLFAGTTPTNPVYVGKFDATTGIFDTSVLGSANSLSIFKAFNIENTKILKDNTTYYWFAVNTTDQKRTAVWSFTTNANGVNQNNGIGPVTFDNINGTAALNSMFGLTYTGLGSIDSLVGKSFPSLALTAGDTLIPSYSYSNQYTNAYIDFNLRIGQSALYNFETHNLYNTATGTYGGNASSIALTANTISTIRRLLPYGEVLQHVTANSGVQGRYLDRLYRITVAPGIMSYNNTILNAVNTNSTADVDFLYPSSSTATTDAVGPGDATDIYSAVVGSTNTNNLSVPETLKILGGTGGFLRFDIGVANYTWRSITDGTAAPAAAGTVPTALDAYDITLLRNSYTYVADLDGTVGLPDDPGYTLNTGLSNEQLSDIHNILTIFANNGMPTANQSYNYTTNIHYASGAIGGPASDFRIYNYILRSLVNFDAVLASNGKTYVQSAADRLRVRKIIENQNYWFGFSKTPAVAFDGNNGDYEAAVSISSSNNNIADMNKFYINTLFNVYFNVDMNCDSQAVYAVGTYYDDATPITPATLDLTYVERTSKQITQDTGYKLNEWIPVRISYDTTAGTYTVSINGVPLSTLTNVAYDRRSAANKQKIPTKVDYFSISKTNVSQNLSRTGTTNWIDNFVFQINDSGWARSVGY